MTTPTVVISENGPASCSITGAYMRDVAHIRRLLLQAAFAFESEQITEHVVPEAKLHLLRGFLANIDCGGKRTARRLLLMALLQLEDEDDAVRFSVPHPLLPIVQNH